MADEFEREAYVPWPPFAIAGAVFALLVTYFFTFAIRRPLVDFVGFGLIALLLCPVGFLVLGWLLAVNPYDGWRRLLWFGAVFVWGTAWLVYLISIAYQFHQRAEYCPVPLTIGAEREPGHWQYLPPYATCPPDVVAWWVSVPAIAVLGFPAIVLARRIAVRRRHGEPVGSG